MYRLKYYNTLSALLVVQTFSSYKEINRFLSIYDVEVAEGITYQRGDDYKVEIEELENEKDNNWTYSKHWNASRRGL